MTREEVIMIMRNERPHCGEKMTFTEEEKCDAYDMAIDALQSEQNYEDKAEVMRIIEDAQIVCHWNATDDFDDIAENIIEQTRKCILSAIEDELLSTEPYTDIVPITDKPIGEFDASTGIVTYYGKTRPSDRISRADAIEAVQDVDTRETVSVSEAVKAINALPSADRPSGEWLDVNGDGSLWQCTNCHNKACCKGNFCNECGARMENTK